jgi:hypothetical protein
VEYVVIICDLEKLLVSHNFFVCGAALRSFAYNNLRSEHSVVKILKIDVERRPIINGLLDLRFDLFKFENPTL